MLLSHRKKFIYTKTVKTAGTSVESYFEKYCMPEGDWTFSHQREEYVSHSGIVGYRGRQPKGKKWLNHMSAQKIQTGVGIDVWNNYFKFCVIRNPYTKLVSAYHHFIERSQKPTFKERVIQQLKKIKTGRTDPADLIQGTTAPERFRSWIKHGGWIDDRDKYFIEGQVCIDHFIMQEDLESGVEEVCDILRIPYEPNRLPKLKKRKAKTKIPLSEYYDRETVDIIHHRYAFEIEKFGYCPPTS
ncbi:MAG: sulfotransferase family 2 domain-containing protein [Cyanobacteria bacterium J06623_5]